MNIGQAAEASGVTAKMIRYYESIGLISEASRTHSGYRQYTQNDIQALRFIKCCRDVGFSIDRIKTLLGLWMIRTRRGTKVKNLAQQYIAELDQNILKVQSLRDQLQQFVDGSDDNTRTKCPAIDDPGTGHRVSTEKSI